jgi:hypothetical protein
MFSKSSLQVVKKMRTKGQLQIGKEPPMLRQIRTAAENAQDTLLGDLLGGAALMVTLVAGLYLPGLL